MSQVHLSRTVKLTQLRLRLVILLIKRKAKESKVKHETVTNIEISQAENGGSLLTCQL